MEIKGTFKHPKNISEILELRKSIEWGPRTISKWKEIIKKSKWIYYLKDGEKLIGMGRIVEDGCMCMIYDVMVRKEYQKQGNGKKIMQALMEKAKTKDYTHIGLFAYDNPELIKFYKSFGFDDKKNGIGLSILKE